MNIDVRGRGAPFAWPAAIGVTLSTLLLIVLLAGWLQRAWEEQRAESVQRAAALTKAITRHVETVLGAIEGDLRNLADRLGRNPAILRQGDAELTLQLRLLRQWSTSIGAVNVFDANGVFVGSSVEEARLGSVLDSPRLRAHAQGQSRASTISPPMKSALLDTEVFSLTTGIHGRDGAFLGMIGALIPTTQFLDLFRELKPAEQSAVLLLLGSGTELVRQVDLDGPFAARIAQPQTRAALARDATMRRTGILEPSTELDLLRIAGRIDRFDLSATTVLDTEALARDWLEKMWVTLFAFLVLALVAIGVNVAIVVQLLRRERSIVRLQLREEQRFRDGIESMADAFALWDPQDRLVLWNARYPEIFPKLRAHLRPGLAYRTMLEIATRAEWPERSAAELDAIVEARMRKRGSPERITIDMADGRVVGTTERRTAEGGVVCLFQDVTEERRVAAELEASNALFRDGIEAMLDGFVLLDTQERVVAWNQAFITIAPHMAEILRPGIPLAESMRFSVERLARRFPELGIDIDAEVARRLEKYRKAESTEAMTATSGRQIMISARRTSAGGTLLIYRDITPIREAEARVQETMARLEAALAAERETNAQHRRFVSMASHEFRTPLAIIDSASQRIAATIAGNEAASKRLGRIRGAVARMAEIIDRTLSSTRLDDGQIAPNFAAFDLVQLVRETAGRQRSISPDFAIDVACDPAQIEIVADRSMIEQVAVNLLSNAIKYSGASRDIAVALQRTEDSVELSVRDNGVGVAADEIPMLFTRYFRAGSAMGIPGTGIGLHLVKELVTLHGGDVRVDSVLGKGSTFRVILPLTQGSELDAAA